MNADQPLPRVSVIIATYNRSNVLALTLRSLIRQTYQDWDAWVIGDACTDDTEEVVNSLGDPRIRYVNLETNHGEQSVPNNEGVRRSRSAYVAYLNHDDFWLPDHLEAALAPLDNDEAELTFSLLDIIGGSGRRVLGGAVQNGIYRCHNYVPASAWVMKRELCERVGPWRSYRECYDAPSQDWLRRAWRSGARMKQVPRLTVVALPSAARLGSYAERQASEHVRMFDRLCNEPDFRERELQALALEAAVLDPRLGNTLDAGLYIRRGLKNLVRMILLSLGWSPAAMLMALRFRRKGAYLRWLRALRGLENNRQ
jgi:glycosyltransferase involved in cell wall biosynthesis